MVSRTHLCFSRSIPILILAQGIALTVDVRAHAQVICRYRFFKLTRRRGATQFRLGKGKFETKTMPYYLDQVSLDELSELLCSPVATSKILKKTKSFPSRAVREYSASQVLAAELADAVCLVRTSIFCSEVRRLASVICKAGDGKRAMKLVRAIFASLTLNDEGADKLVNTFTVRYALFDESERTRDSKKRPRAAECTQTNCEEARSNQTWKRCTMEERDTATEHRVGTPDLTIAI